jgi:hypothetical protein
MTNPASVKDRLRNLAVKTHRPFDYLLMHYFIERLLYRLSISPYADNFILKGGLLLYTIFQEDARATKDIDFLGRNIAAAPEKLTRIFSEIILIPSDDAVLFDEGSISAESIREGADYEGVRIKLTAYLDKSRHILQFDVGFGDVIIPDPVEMEYPSLLDMETPRLKAYPLESVIAEKFQAIVYLGEANSRMKDFYDIYELCGSFDFDGNVLCEAIRKTFERRMTPLPQVPSVFSDTFPLLPDKNTQWKAFQKRIGITGGKSFQEVSVALKLFLSPIYDCLLAQKPFFGKWNGTPKSWKH